MTEPSLFDLPTSLPTQPAKRGTFTEQVKRALVANGSMDEDTGATRNARMAKCHNCKRPVIIGLVNPQFGTYAIECDPNPLSSSGELAAILAGAVRYRVVAHGGRWEIAHRDIFSLRGKPAGSANQDVLIRHECGKDNPFDTMPSALRVAAKPTVELSDTPPF